MFKKKIMPELMTLSMPVSELELHSLPKSQYLYYIHCIILYYIEMMLKGGTVALYPYHGHLAGLLEDVKRQRSRNLSLPWSPSRLSEDSP